jgi:hypothetical protein
MALTCRVRFKFLYPSPDLGIQDFHYIRDYGIQDGMVSKISILCPSGDYDMQDFHYIRNPRFSSEGPDSRLVCSACATHELDGRWQ